MFLVILSIHTYSLKLAHPDLKSNFIADSYNLISEMLKRHYRKEF